MTTGPRPTPHPIVLHLDDAGTPVRFAESSSIFVSSVSAVTINVGTISATTWLGLNSQAGLPAGPNGSVQFTDGQGGLLNNETFTFDDTEATLYVNYITVDLSGSFDSIKSNSISSTSLSSNQITTPTLSATTISAVTVCATNYNNLFDALSFQNLDARYLNSSGDSVTGSFTLTNLNATSISATNISATNYLNIPSTSAIWNASSIRGIAVTGNPAPGQALIYLNNFWQPSSVAGVGGVPDGPEGSIQIRNGSFFSGVEDIKYNSSLSALQSTRVSATTVSAGTVSAGTILGNTISATNYLNIPSTSAIWNANKIQGTPFQKGSLANQDLIGYETQGDGGAWKNYTKDVVAQFLYPIIFGYLPSGTAIWNASSIQGVTVTSTAPGTNNVLIYNGSVWAPSSAISLTTVSSTNLSGTDIVGTRLNVTNLSAATVSSTSLSAVSARITGLSATTISATNWQGLPISNASALNGIEVLAVDNSVTGTTIGAFFYSRPNNQYYTLPFSSTPVAGGRSISEPAYAQGQVVASYLGSATNTLQINAIFGSPINDFPENKDVLTFSSGLYGYPVSGWTWIQPSTLVPAAGSTGYLQFAGPGGAFSGDANLTYNATSRTLTGSSINLPSGSIFLAAPSDPTYISNQGINTKYLQVFGSIISPQVSATTYNIFGAFTSSTYPSLAHNQNIVYDTTGTNWKPGYTVYQATGTPSVGLGSNGDIYFQYLP